jgi:hypothetical protein
MPTVPPAPSPPIHAGASIQGSHPEGAGGNATGGTGSDAIGAHELDAIRELRVLEERAVNLRKKAQLADENLLAAEARLRDEIKAVTGEITDLRHRLADVEEGLRTVRDEMAHAASVTDVRSLEKYLAYWEPVQFVTHAEIVRRENLLKGQDVKGSVDARAPRGTGNARDGER